MSITNISAGRIVMPILQLAEIAAAGQIRLDAQIPDAGGGTLPEHLGQIMLDAHMPSTEIAAAGQSTIDAQTKNAGGGTLPLVSAIVLVMPGSTLPRSPPLATALLMTKNLSPAAAPLPETRG